MAPQAVIAGGAGATLSLDQVLAVVHGAQVVLDSAASQRVKKDSPAPKSFQPEQPPAEAPPCSSALDRSQCRAALFFKLLALINGKSGVRLAVVEALAALLNAGASPVLPAADTDAVPLASLAAFLQGVGAAAGPDGAQQTAADALAAAGVEAPGLSAAERGLVQDGQSVSAGTASICVQAGKLLLAVANAAAALSAEALQADIKALDADAVEAQPHKGAIEAAEEIRGLLDGSRQVNGKKAGAGSVAALNAAPQVHGALLEALNAAAAPAKAELAAAALPPAKDGQPQQSGSPSLAAGLLLLATAFLKAAGLSLKRSAAVAGRLQTVAAAAAAGAPPADAAPLQAALQAAAATAAAAVDAGKRQAAETSGKLALAEPDEAAPSLAAALAAYAALHALQQALALEALAAATSLRLQEGKPADGAAAAAAAAGAAAAAANGGADAGKKKDKKKDKGGPQGMQLGKGAAQLRAYVENAAAGGSLSASGDDVAGALRTLSLDGGDADLAAQLARG